jgi:hypothetical protein
MSDLHQVTLSACQAKQNLSTLYSMPLQQKISQMDAKDPQLFVYKQFQKNLVDPNNATVCGDTLAFRQKMIAGAADQCNADNFTNRFIAGDNVYLSNKCKDLADCAQMSACQSFGGKSNPAIGLDCSSYMGMDMLQEANKKRCPPPS